MTMRGPSKRVQYSFRIDPDLLDRALARAKADDLSLAQVLRRFLREHYAPEPAVKESD